MRCSLCIVVPITGRLRLNPPNLGMHSPSQLLQLDSCLPLTFDLSGTAWGCCLIACFFLTAPSGALWAMGFQDLRTLHLPVPSLPQAWHDDSFLEALQTHPESLSLTSVAVAYCIILIQCDGATLGYCANGIITVLQYFGQILHVITVGQSGKAQLRLLLNRPSPWRVTDTSSSRTTLLTALHLFVF